MQIKEIFDYLTNLYPLENGSSFDQGKIGLQFGNLEDEIKGVICCLDVTMDVIDEAIKKDANLIISHHPFMFQPLLNLRYSSPLGKKIMKIINHKINIMAFHTNFDVGQDGMNDILAKKLGLTNIQYTTPFINQDSFLRIGEVNPVSTRDYLEIIKKSFNLSFLKVAGPLDKMIKRVAIVGGAGSSDFYEAMKLNVDLYISGELHHHQGIEAFDFDTVLVEVPHAIEFYGVEELYNRLSQTFKQLKWFLFGNHYDPFLIY